MLKLSSCQPKLFKAKFVNLPFKPICSLKFKGMLSSVLEMISTIIPVSLSLENSLREKMIIESYPKKTLLLKQGQVASHVYFINKGIVRAYYYLNNQQVTRLFLKENDIVISALSFLQREPSQEFLETLEDCELAMIHYDDLNALYEEFIDFNRVGRHLIGDYYCKSEKRMMWLKNLSAKEKYELMLKTSPEIFNRVQLKYIATYLGMSIENISRIRSKIK